MTAKAWLTDGYVQFGITTPGLENTLVFFRMPGVSGAGLLESQPPTEFNQIWCLQTPQQQAAPRGLQRCVGGLLNIKPFTVHMSYVKTNVLW